MDTVYPFVTERRKAYFFLEDLRLRYIPDIRSIPQNMLWTPYLRGKHCLVSFLCCQWFLVMIGHSVNAVGLPFQLTLLHFRDFDGL